MLPMLFNAVHSIPGIENEKDIPGNASHVIQCSSLNSRYRQMRKIYLEILPLSFNAVDPGIVNEKNKTGNASHVIQCSSLHSRYRK